MGVGRSRGVPVPDAATQVPVPSNEPVRGYAPGSGERASLEAKLKELGSADPVELTMTIGGQQRLGTGDPIDGGQPPPHPAGLRPMRGPGNDEVRAAGGPP